MRIKITILLMVICVVLAGLLGIIKIRQDKTPPEIYFSEEEQSYAEGAGNKEFLKGVHAKDNRDGDVTDSLKIESVYEEPEEGTITVIYTAKDKSNNVTKIQKSYKLDTAAASQGESVQDASVTAENTAMPQIILTTDTLELPAGSSFNALEYIENVTDDKDSSEDLWKRIVVTGQVDTAAAGQYQIQYYVTDSDGNQSATATLTVHIL